ncbi:LptF/LptG family permease [Candidatus Pelagibacter bacterium nBUS_36]|uniref:LptF/LptG family permease n=1 Tax=Candidatus Pelagibacter bacterium nBUS_36 TaxID=3374194 RepID=UPI003EBA298A
MKKILFNKLLTDCLIFFFIALFFTSIIIWIFQAVNYLDIMIEDGRDHLVYLKFTILIFPKIVSKILPFIFFLSFIYVITKYELNNELVIFWNFGVNKIVVVNYFFKFSIILAIFQIFLNSVVVPASQDQARSYLRTSNINFLENFIKPKKFNDTVKDLTIYSDSKDENGSFTNIYIKKGRGFSDFQTTYAKKGNFKTIGNKKIFELYNGETISVVKGKITNFKFLKSNFSLNNLKTNTITHRKTQEVSTLNLILCFKNIYKRKSIDLSKELKIENCRTENINNIIKEFHKRMIVPLYIPVLMLLTLLLIIESKENINYLKFRLVIFLIGVLIIIISEMTLRFVNDNLINNLGLLFIPFALIAILYLIFTYKYNLINRY